jgi:fatty-acyl-CoA synthase
MKIIKGFPADPENHQLNMIDIMKHAVRNYAKQEILSRNPDGSLFKYTYKDSYKRMKQLANALVNLGVKPGDRIGVLSWNNYQFFEIYFGVPGIGAVMVTLNLRLSIDELIYIVNHAGIKYLIVDYDLLNVADLISHKCDLSGYILIAHNNLSEIKTDMDPLFSYEKIVSESSDSYDWPIIDENSAYAACYTTGTTGKPKGVYYSHRNAYIQTIAFASVFLMSVDDCMFQMVPMFHVLGWSKPMAGVYAGSKMIFSGRWTMNDLDEIAELMMNEGVTASAGVPAVFSGMLEKIKKMDKKPDLSKARFISGGAAPPISVMKGIYDLTGAKILHSYGSTEAMAITTLNMSKPWLEKEFSDEERWELKKKQGAISVGIDVKIIDDGGHELPFDGESSGEILLRGPWITRSYLNAPGTEDRFTEDGYFKTGDAGTIDPEGYLKITDRIKDVIKSGGEWISSIDMENAIVSHPKVLEAAVIGLIHPKFDERPLALIVPREQFKGKIEKEEIRELLLKTFVKWQLPDEILFVDSIPRTSVGKINKKVLRSEYEDLYTK